jgi:hypothetical protein
MGNVAACEKKTKTKLPECVYLTKEALKTFLTLSLPKSQLCDFGAEP